MVHVKSMNVVKLNRSQTKERSSQKSSNVVRVQIMLERDINRYVQVYKYGVYYYIYYNP